VSFFIQIQKGSWLIVTIGSSGLSALNALGELHAYETLVVCSFLHAGIRFKMKPPKYTAKQIDEIIDRITALRIRWLQSVEAQLASPSTATSSAAGTHLAGYNPGRNAPPLP
jgi:hypothetical protein